MTKRMFALFAVSLVGCAAESPEPETRAWPCGSIETGGYYDLANVHARYQYDDRNNVVWRQEINYEDSPNYGQIIRTETKLFDGDVAFFEELVAGDWHDKTTRDLVDGRIVRSTYANYTYETDYFVTSTWTYDGDRVSRIDFDATDALLSGSSTFTYPDRDTRVERSCGPDEVGAEECTTTTLVGGVDSWTTSRTDDDGDGSDDYEQVRELDANGLPILIEGYYLSNGVRSERTSHVEIERRADGAPLHEDNGFTQIEYLFECDAD